MRGVLDDQIFSPNCTAERTRELFPRPPTRLSRPGIPRTSGGSSEKVGHASVARFGNRLSTYQSSRTLRAGCMAIFTHETCCPIGECLRPSSISNPCAGDQRSTRSVVGCFIGTSSRVLCRLGQMRRLTPPWSNKELECASPTSCGPRVEEPANLRGSCLVHTRGADGG
jgi:hypothetical protein